MWLDVLKFGNGHRYSSAIKFVESWFGGIEPEDGIPTTELGDKGLPGPLPAALAEWYALVGLRDDLFRQDHVLLRPSELEWWDDRLVFWTSRDAHVLWFIERKHIAADDPPISVFIHDAAGAREIHTTQRLARFVTQMLLVETSLAVAEHGLTARLGNVARDELSPIYQPLPLASWPVVCDAMFGRDDTVITLSKTGRLHLGARDRDAFRRALTYLEGRGIEIEVEWTG